MNRIFKKIFYGLLFIFILSLFLLSLFLKTEKNDDNKNNILSLEIKDEPKVFYLNNEKAVIVFKIFNPNPELSVINFLYNLKIYSFDNKLIDDILNKGYIYYNEEKYFLSFISANIYKKIKKIDINLMNFDFLDKKILFKPLIKLENVFYEDFEEGIFIKGEISNFSDFDLNQIDIFFLFKDKQNKILSAYFYTFNELFKNSKEKFNFKIKFNEDLKKEIDFNNTKIFVYGK